MTGRVLVTGASGFIGRHAAAALRAAGFEVHGLSRRAAGLPGVAEHAADVLDPEAMRRVMAAVRPSHLLHLAWYVEPGAYWQAAANLDWVAASLALARRFAEAGGRRMVGAGTCAEYAWGAPVLEEGAAAEPATLYGASKDAVRRVLAAWAPGAEVSFAWGRVFYVYGPGEAPGRLVGDAVRVLRAGGRLAASHGRQRRDFLHVADVGGAFAALVAGTAEGVVNVGSGRAVPVREVLDELAALLGGEGRIDFGARPLPPGEPDTIEASVRRLRDEVGFRPRFGLRDGLRDVVGRAA